MFKFIYIKWLIANSRDGTNHFNVEKWWRHIENNNAGSRGTCTISCRLFGVVDFGSPYEMVVNRGR